MDQTETFLATVKDTVEQLETLIDSGVYPPVMMRQIITKLSAVSKRGLPATPAPAPVAAPAEPVKVAEQPKTEEKK